MMGKMAIATALRGFNDLDLFGDIFGHFVLFDQIGIQKN